MPISYGEILTKNQAFAGIWGIGYIGYSTMIHLASEGIRCIGMDIDPARINAVNAGLCPVPGLKEWLEMDPVPFVNSGMIKGTLNSQDILSSEVLVHFIAIPTERGGQPWWEPLRDVVSRIANAIKHNSTYRPLVIVESTLTPGTTDDIIIPIFKEHGITIGQDILLGIAPRRDWFVKKELSLRTLDRIYCGINDESAEATLSVLRILCDKLHRASHHYVGELVKCVENAYRHMEITLANQLCLAYPHVSIREVLELAGTKWNMQTYHPSFGTGGYCIPLSSHYVLEGATTPSELSILSATIETDMRMRELVAQVIINRGCKNVAILGLAYRGNLKVSVMSPTIAIAKYLKNADVQVRVFDPYYTAEEIYSETGALMLAFPEDLHEFDGILVTTNHQEFLVAQVKEIITSRTDKPVIIDNYGIWADWNWLNGSNYFRAGDAGWLTWLR